MQAKYYFQPDDVSPENVSWSKYFLLFFLFFLVACGGSDSEGGSGGSASTRNREELPLPPGVSFKGQNLTNYPHMQNIAIDGDRALVGDPANNQLYSFRYESGAWVRQPNPVKCYANNGGEVTGKFGYSVAMDGVVAIAGGPIASVAGGSNNGSTCEYALRNGQWDRPRGGSGINSPWIGSRYGLSVSIAGKNTIENWDGVVFLVGAPGARITENDPRSAVVGKFRTWIRTGRNSWQEEDSAEHGEAPNSVQFGSAVSTDGQTAVIGDFQWRGTRFLPIDRPWRGAVYFYKRTNPDLSTRPSRTPGSGWTAQGRFTGDDVRLHRLGYSVSVHGDTAIVSAASKSQKDEYILVFTRSGNTWSVQQYIDLDNTFNYEEGRFTSFQFRTSLAIHGDTFIVGIERPDRALGTPNFTQEVRIYKRDRTKATDKQWELDSTFNNRGGRAVAYKGGKFLTSGEVVGSTRSAVWSYSP